MKLWTVPCGTPSCTVISGAGVCVGPMMKLPSASAGGTAPSGSSFAVTYPGVFGSRVGGVGRAGGVAVCAAGAGVAGVPAVCAIAVLAPAIMPMARVRVKVVLVMVMSCDE